MTDFINKVKSWGLGVGAALIAVLTGLFFYERNKMYVDEALVKEDQLNKTLTAESDEITTNNQELNTQEEDRQQLSKGAQNAANEPTDQNIIDLFNSRK